jgi:hypothetical protein
VKLEGLRCPRARLTWSALRRRKEGRREQTLDSHICSKRRLPLLISGGQHDGAPLSAGVWLAAQRVLCVLSLSLLLLLSLAGFLTCARLARGRRRRCSAVPDASGDFASCREALIRTKICKQNICARTLRRKAIRFHPSLPPSLQGNTQRALLVDASHRGPPTPRMHWQHAI